MEIVKMFGPSISNPTRIVNRDVPACDELAYKAAGYKRGSIPEEPEVVEAAVEPAAELVADPVVDTPKPRKKKGQN